MTGLTLRDAAEYVRTSRASRAPSLFLRLILTIKHIYNFTQERANRLVRYVVVTRAYKAGKPVREIQAKYGCSLNTINRYARLAELPKRPKHFPEEIKKDVIADYKKGLRVAEIARLHDVSPAYVSRTAREMGISRYRKRK